MLTAEQRERLRRDLVDRLVAIYRPVRDDITAAIISRAFPADPEDEEDDALRDELASLLDEYDRERAHQLEAALRRMQNREYGYCADCGRPIPFERLRAAPWTERCADDQARVEEEERAARGSGPPTL